MTQPTYEPVPPPPPRVRRSLSTWLLLLAVWTVGLVFWCFYVGVALYVLYRLIL